MSGPLQFAVVRIGDDEFKIIVQDDRSTLRAYHETLAGAREAIIEELLKLNSRAVS